MKKNIIEEEELDLLNPNRKLNNITKDEYTGLYSIYRKLFTEYMIEKLNLKEYDERIKSSGLNFCANKEKDMDLYQYFSSEYLDYFYLRNNLYVERLNDKELNFLRRKLELDNYDLDDESRLMIEKTYQKVIFEDVLGNGEECTTFFGPSSGYMAKNNGVVIGVRYDEFARNGLTDDKWDELHNRQKNFLTQLIGEMKENIEKNISGPIYIFRYNEFSIRKRNKEREEEER